VKTGMMFYSRPG